MNITSKITLILLVLFLLVTNSIAGKYAEGLSFFSGINFDNAILIEDVDDLIKLSKDYNNWDKYYKQTADIIFADSLKQDWGWDDNGEKTNGFRPIGTSSYPFSGGYDGGGYVIDNLYINANDDDDKDDIRSGLFYRVEASGQDTVYIKNINIGSNSKIISDLMWTAFPVSGALIAYGTGNIFVDSCSSSAEVSTYDVIESQDTLSSGGLIGKLSRATITISNSINKGNIRTTSKIINYAFSGGLIGYSKESNITINNSTNSGNIVALSDKYSACGGLIGGGRDYSVIRIDKSTNNGNVSCGYNGDLTTTS